MGPLSATRTVKVLLTLVVLGMGVCLEAGERRVFRGDLGGKPVLLELSEHHKKWEGRYCYEQYGVDIPLKGTLEQLQEPAPTRPDAPGPAPAAIWKGSLLNKRYSGTWHGKRSLVFRLDEIARYDPDRVKPDSVQATTEAITPGIGPGIAYDAEISLASTPYDYLKLTSHLEEGPEELRGSLALRWVKETRTRIAYPRLSRHPRSGAAAAANRILEQHHFRLVLGALGCAATVYDPEPSSAAGGFGGFSEELIAVPYLSADLMCVVESGSTFCGGAHPDNHFEPYTLDLRKGGYLDWNRLFKNRRIDRKTGRPAWQGQLIARLGRRKAPVDADSVDCRSLLPDYLALQFEHDRRLQLCISGIGHAGGCCLGVEGELPLQDYRELLSKEGQRYLGVPAVVKGTER